MISLWLLISFCLQLEHSGFANFMLLGSSLLPVWSIFFVTVSLLHFDAPCFFQSPWTLFAQEYNVLVFWSWCCFVCSVIPTWYISSLVILMRLPVLRFLMNSMCRPSKMEYDFFWCSWLLDLRTIPTFCILECFVFECLFGLTKNYFGFFRKWCSTGSVCYTLAFLFYLITSFSRQFNVFVFGSCCCFGFSIFLLWFIPSLVIVMCYTVLWFFMNVMLSRPSMKEYDFSVASDFVLLTTRTLWLCELHAFGFLPASSMIHIFCDCFTAPLWCTMFFPISMNTFCSRV